MTHNRKKHGGGERPGEQHFPSVVFFVWLHDLCHEISHRFCSLLLYLPGGVGVGSEGEACIIVPQHIADCFYIYAVLEGQSSECVSQSMEGDMFQLGVLQNFLMEFCRSVGIVHFSGDRRWEHIGTVWMFLMFLNEEVNCFLRDGYFAHRGVRFGPGECELAVGIADVLLADRDRLPYVHLPRYAMTNAMLTYMLGI